MVNIGNTRRKSIISRTKGGSEKEAKLKLCGTNMAFRKENAN